MGAERCLTPLVPVLDRGGVTLSFCLMEGLFPSFGACSFNACSFNACSLASRATRADSITPFIFAGPPFTLTDGNVGVLGDCFGSVGDRGDGCECTCLVGGAFTG